MRRNVSSLTFTLSLPIWNNGERELAIIQARTSRNVARASGPTWSGRRCAT